MSRPPQGRSPEDAASRREEIAPIAPEEARALLAPLFDTFPEGLVLAVSGGPDSVALAALCAEVARGRGGPPLLVASVDHGLRPDSSADAQAVARLAARLGLPARILVWEGRKPARGLQAAARAARYALLAEAARAAGARAIVTAHHRDDQAETVLMRLAAGSGLSGLAGMRPLARRHGLVVARPLLGIAKDRLVATCLARSLPFVEDPANSAPRFARARLREAAPALAREGLDAARLATLARRLARADEALDAMAERLLAESMRTEAPAAPASVILALDARIFLDAPEELRLRVLVLARDRVLATLDEASQDEGEGGREPYRRLERLEAMEARLVAALGVGAPFRETIGGVLVEAQGGSLRLRPEPPRRGSA